jgi:hypothetical protein
VKERLQPASAVSKLNERVKKIGKVNSDIADWLQVRRSWPSASGETHLRDLGAPKGRGCICGSTEKARPETAARGRQRYGVLLF